MDVVPLDITSQIARTIHQAQFVASHDCRYYIELTQSELTMYDRYESIRSFALSELDPTLRGLCERLCSFTETVERDQGSVWRDPAIKSAHEQLGRYFPTDGNMTIFKDAVYVSLSIPIYYKDFELLRDQYFKKHGLAL